MIIIINILGFILAMGIVLAIIEDVIWKIKDKI
jgi:hypothetical protein